MRVFGNAKRNAVMRSITFNKSTFEQVLRYILMNSSAFLHCVKRDAIPERKSVVCLQQICVSLVDFIAVNADNYFLLYLVNFIVRHRKMSAPLLIEHFLDITAYSIQPKNLLSAAMPSCGQGQDDEASALEYELSILACLYHQLQILRCLNLLMTNKCIVL